MLQPHVRGSQAAGRRRCCCCPRPNVKGGNGYGTAATRTREESTWEAPEMVVTGEPEETRTDEGKDVTRAWCVFIPVSSYPVFPGCIGVLYKPLGKKERHMESR